jgi:hypothetical protein
MRKSTVYFLGAGASAADQLPLTNELNLANVSYLVGRDLKTSALATYYRRLYGIDARQLKKAAKMGFKSFRTAAITLAGVELAHRIRKRQFSFGRGHRGQIVMQSLKSADFSDDALLLPAKAWPNGEGRYVKKTPVWAEVASELAAFARKKARHGTRAATTSSTTSARAAMRTPCPLRSSRRSTSGFVRGLAARDS